jgi:hypothetical protein
MHSGGRDIYEWHGRTTGGDKDVGLVLDSVLLASVVVHCTEKIFELRDSKLLQTIRSLECRQHQIKA